MRPVVLFEDAQEFVVEQFHRSQWKHRWGLCLFQPSKGSTWIPCRLQLRVIVGARRKWIWHLPSTFIVQLIRSRKISLCLPHLREAVSCKVDIKDQLNSVVRMNEEMVDESARIRAKNCEL
ncbi:hypothetical protein Q1695_015551 [Nippostrongylus brasiliensis]|nr:hypothetical protein Q1695_015551 [Nippostrongylus brasiliensis]